MNLTSVGCLATSAWRRIRTFFASMTGRLFVILAAGMLAAALIGAAITKSKSDREFAQQLLERAADRLESYVDLIDALPAEMRETLLTSNSAGFAGGGIKLQPEDIQGEVPDIEFQAVLTQRGGTVAKSTIQRAGYEVCFPEIRSMSLPETQRIWESEEFRRAISRMPQRPARQRAHRAATLIPPVCRLITLTLTDGTLLRFSQDTPWIERERSRFLDPAFISFLILAVGLLAYVAARIASAPLHGLSEAAAELGQDLDRAPVEVSGPTEVRRAAEAFNAMQRRLQQHVGERTRMLASITHDLQTPLTRLRLRLERVDDETLRERLVADLGAMSDLIEEGLELVRSAETAEPRVSLDLDSLLESLVEDAADAGANATFEHGCRAVLQVRPLAARRLFSNLIENALKYGNGARVSSRRDGDAVSVSIRDTGPGIPPDMLERVFEPFVRLDASRSRESGGAGLGLTIARTLAEKNGATLTLRNRPEGGLEATVRWPKATVKI